MKKLLVIVLALIAIWIGGRYILHRGDMRATIVMHDAATLRAGDPVVENGAAVGRVTKISRLDGDDAVSIRIDRNHRRAVVSDSLFAADGRTLAYDLFLGIPVHCAPPVVVSSGLAEPGLRFYFREPAKNQTQL